MQIGIVGAGAMGRQMALSLMGAGHEVTVWNRSSGPVDALVKEGVKRAEQVEDTFQGDLALSVLFDDEAIRSVLLDGALTRAKRSCIHACTSTISVALGHELVQVHQDVGLAYFAAPMLGRPETIPKQGLNFLVGGETAVVDKVRAPLETLGTLWHMGLNPVEGQVAKLAANFMIGGAIEAMAEATAVLRTQGADPATFFSIMGETLFSGFVHKSYGQMIAGQAPAELSGLALPLKDNGLFLAAGEGTAARLPLAEAVRSNLQKASEADEKADWATALAGVAQGRT